MPCLCRLVNPLVSFYHPVALSGANRFRSRAPDPRQPGNDAKRRLRDSIYNKKDRFFWFINFLGAIEVFVGVVFAASWRDGRR